MVSPSRWFPFLILPALTFATIFSACVPSTPAERLGCDNSTDCDGGICVDGQCTPGDVGEDVGPAPDGGPDCDGAPECAPDPGSCDPECDSAACLHCVEEVCVSLCEPGTQCDGSGSCIPEPTEPQGGLGQPCYPDQTCDAPYACLEGICVEPTLEDPCDSPERQPPADWVRMSTGSLSCHWDGGTWANGSDCREWDQVWPSPFNPDGTGTTRYLGPRVPSGRSYIALRFNSGDFPADHRGEFSLNTAPNIQNATKIMTLSTCPGDFHEAAIRDVSQDGTGCIISTLLDSLRWGGADSGRTCQLEPNTEYYFNIVFTEASLGELTWSQIQPHPNCVDARCGSLFRNR